MNEKKLFYIVSISIILKFLFITFWTYFKYPFLSGDAYLYWDKANLIANTKDFFIDKAIPSSFMPSTYGINLLTLINAFFIKFLSSNALQIKYVIISCHIISTILIFNITKRVFNRSSAYISTIIFSFWPSYLIWFSANYKEPLIITSILSFIYLLQKIKISDGYKKKITYIVILFLIFFFQYYLQSIIIIIELVSLIIYILFFYFNIYFKIIILNLFFIIILTNLNRIENILIDGLWDVAQHAETQARVDDAGFFQYRFFEIDKFAKNWCFPYNFNYKLQNNCNEIKYIRKKIYIKTKKWLKQSELYSSLNIFGWITSLFIGLYYAIFSPFPWSIGSINQLIFAPFMYIWYLILLFFIFSIKKLIEINKFKEVFFSISILILSYIIMALSEGNIGGVFRHRDWVNFIIIIISSYSINEFIKKTKNNNKKTIDF